MAQIEQTSLTRYKLTEQEEIQGGVLTELNLFVLQNMIADISELRLNLIFDVTNPAKFAQDEAYLKGKLDIVRAIMDNHVSSLTANLKIVSNSTDN